MARSYTFEGSGARLKQLRRQLELSHGEMARKLGLSTAAYYKNESGETFPGYAALALLEKELDVSMDWLMFGKGPIHYNKERQRVETLEKERDREREKTAAIEGKLIVDDKPGLKELFDYMDRVPLLYHEIMVYFQKFKTTPRDPEGTTDDTAPV